MPPSCTRRSRSGGLPAGLPHTDPTFYLQKAAHWANAYITGPEDAADTLNLYDVCGLAHYELYRAIAQAGNPSGLETTQAALLADMKKALDGAVAQAGTDPFGFGFTWAAWDTTTHGAGLSVQASEYDELSGTSTYAAYADRWLSNILGANAWGLSFIVGDGATFPHCSAAPGGEPRRLIDGRLAGACRRGRRGTELLADARRGLRHDRLPGERRRHLRAFQRQRRAVPRQHAVVRQHRARHRSDRVIAAGIRAADRRTQMKERPKPAFQDDLALGRRCR